MKFQKGHTTNVSHGHTQSGRSPEYACWLDIKRRCLNKKFKHFRYYGGRGIQICERWRNDFGAFLADVGERPTPRHTIDRFPNNNGNYEPGNVRWATRKEQVANRRSTRFVAVGTKIIPLFDAIRELGLDRSLVCGRIERGWTAERAITEPARWHRPDLARDGKREKGQVR